jgi:hypothetical protein
MKHFLEFRVEGAFKTHRHAAKEIDEIDHAQ